MRPIYISNVITVCVDGTVAWLDGLLLHACDISVWRYFNGDVIKDGLSYLIKCDSAPNKFVFITTDGDVYLTYSYDLFGEYDGEYNCEDVIFGNAFCTITESLQLGNGFPFKCKLL